MSLNTPAARLELVNKLMEQKLLSIAEAKELLFFPHVWLPIKSDRDPNQLMTDLVTG